LQIKILGCSGGIGGSRRTTSILLGDDTLIDCGTGVLDLEIEELVKIRRVFLTHTHLDHLLSLPLMLDTVQEEAELQPLQLYLTRECDQIIREHLFNWKLWPDFFNLGGAEPTVLESNIHTVGELIKTDQCELQMLPANHSVPAVGYLVRSSSGGSLAFSGDSTSNDQLWETLNQQSDLDHLIIECSYTDAEQELSIKAKHYCSSSLAEDLKKLKLRPDIYLTHLKPGAEDEIVAEVQKLVPDRSVKALRNGQQFEL